ncbi:hypothetical protein LBMAG52_36540 [Planctomycetia bacterium]|nr:hypothetical protein LBMAG52_36540 [Planctomycetia bacterium]
MVIVPEQFTPAAAELPDTFPLTVHIMLAPIVNPVDPIPPVPADTLPFINNVPPVVVVIAGPLREPM